MSAAEQQHEEEEGMGPRLILTKRTRTTPGQRLHPCQGRCQLCKKYTTWECSVCSGDRYCEGRRVVGSTNTYLSFFLCHPKKKRDCWTRHLLESHGISNSNAMAFVLNPQQELELGHQIITKKLALPERKKEMNPLALSERKKETNKLNDTKKCAKKVFSLRRKKDDVQASPSEEGKQQQDSSSSSFWRVDVLAPDDERTLVQTIYQEAMQLEAKSQQSMVFQWPKETVAKVKAGRANLFVKVGRNFHILESDLRECKTIGDLYAHVNSDPEGKGEIILERYVQDVAKDYGSEAYDQM